jgi:hypothetical protein
MTRYNLIHLIIDAITGYAAAFATAWTIPFDVTAQTRPVPLMKRSRDNAF